MHRSYGTLVLLAAAFAALNARTETAWEARQARETGWMDSGLAIIPHKPTYFLPFAYNSSLNQDPGGSGQETLDKTEAKFQFSFKIPVLRQFLTPKSQVFFAYTQVNFWQLYNKDVSSPFRDTNYEPEIFLNLDTAKQLGPLQNRALQLGFVHQSNGRTDLLSRSWNRIYAQFHLEHRNLVLSIKPWYRIPEPESDDNNPDIHTYMGYGELRLAALWKSQVLSAMLRNNLNWNNNKGALDLSWSFPLSRYLKGYVQYFNGYGECLLDYNHASNRIGIGIAASDWL